MNELCLIILISVSTLTSCNNKKDMLYPNIDAGCDTTIITYSQSVSPVISSTCLGCHGGTNASAGIRLDNYAGVKQQALSGLLLKAVTHAPGVSPMPKNGTKLSDCNIAKIRKWIEAGALQN